MAKGCHVLHCRSSVSEMKSPGMGLIATGPRDQVVGSTDHEDWIMKEDVAVGGWMASVVHLGAGPIGIL